MNLTTKQLSIITTLIEKDSTPTGANALDIDQLIEAVPYDVSKAAIQFSLRSLVTKGMIKKCADVEKVLRRGRRRRTYVVSEVCYKVMAGRKDPAFTAYL